MSVRGLCGWSQGEGVRMFAGRGPKHGCLRSEWEGGGARELMERAQWPGVF